MTIEPQSDLVELLIEMVLETLPDATMRPMYGGTVIELIKNEPKSRIGGIYAYKAHVSLEFTEGAFLPDPDQRLEGTGKKRRHIKLVELGRDTAEKCKSWLRSAAARKNQ